MRDAEALIGQLRQELAASAATNAGSVTRLEDVRQLLTQTREILDRARDEYAAEREKLAERTRLAEDRFADMEKRALLDIDRERTASAKLQKMLETERTEHAKLIEKQRSHFNSAQADLGRLREQIGGLLNATTGLKDERDRAHGQLQEIRAQLEASIRQAAVDAARADHLSDELQRLRDGAKPKSTATKAPARKATSGPQNQRSKVSDRTVKDS